ncbi:MAG: acetate kinase [Candidatus ainarchaeum sp.]|nr:acetate kinase [Candidatus ainarchaeum sp.]
MDILVINCGSSSLKFQLINMADENVLAKGVVEEIGKNSKITFKKNEDKTYYEKLISNHEDAVKEVINFLLGGVIKSVDEIDAIGHRIVHGGEKFTESVIVDENVIDEIIACSDLAPLHNPAHVSGIKACQKLFPNKKMVVVFDTAFHQTMKKEAYLYPLPYEYYEKYKIRKYGFHGTSHKYVSKRASEILGKDVTELNLITCHLGNGSSLTAIEKGKSVNTTMGFTPLAGLMMGTRCGDIDPAIITYLMKKENLTVEKMDEILNKKSGLLGLSGVSSDCREVEKEAWENNNERAQIALDKLGFRIKEYLGAYIAIMNGVDAIIFTGGLGENSPETREFVCRNLDHIGIILDKEKNKIRGKEAIISIENSKIKILVVPTNEELMIARETKELIS